MVQSIDEFRTICPLKEFQYDKITFRNKLGQGGNAAVYKISIDDVFYAGKVYKIEDWCERNGNLETFYECLEYELKIAKKLEKAKYCIQTYGYSFSEGKMIIIMELLNSENGDLQKYLSDEKKWKTPI